MVPRTGGRELQREREVRQLARIGDSEQMLHTPVADSERDHTDEVTVLDSENGGFALDRHHPQPAPRVQFEAAPQQPRHPNRAGNRAARTPTISAAASCSLTNDQGNPHHGR
jgi:hypothetical protein